MNQLKYISLLNTTYFDKEGNKAYKKKRFCCCLLVMNVLTKLSHRLSQNVSISERINNILYFLTDYKKWRQTMARSKTVLSNFS